MKKDASLRGKIEKVFLFFADAKRVLLFVGAVDTAERLYAYHFRKVHQLQEEDRLMRVGFCEWTLQQINANPDFVNNMIFSNESGFDRDGTFNSHNEHYWAEENPNATVVANHQQRFSINVWGAILGNYCHGPVAPPQRLRAPPYCEMLNQQLSIILQNAADVNNVWFQHDGAPAHSAHLTRQLLNARFPNRWIGIGAQQQWPPRSPDPNPIDFFLRGFVENKVYLSEIENQHDLDQHVQQAFLLVTERMLINMRRNFVRRLELCIECGGGHFKHLL